MEEIKRKTAQQIVDTVKEVCGQNINFIDGGGMIIASTDAYRVGSFHETGKRVVLTGSTIEVEQDGEVPGVKAGVNIPVIKNGRAIAAVGISGKPEEVRKYAHLTQRITMLILREKELEQFAQNRKNRIQNLIRSLIQGNMENIPYVKRDLEKMGLDLNGKYCTILIRLGSGVDGLPDTQGADRRLQEGLEACDSPLYTFRYPNEYILILEYEKMEEQEEHV